MADSKSISRSGYRTHSRLTVVETTRIAELAYRYSVWISDPREPETPEQFADTVLGNFEALLVDHAELAGYRIRAAGYCTQIGELAAKVPPAWRPGWEWPYRRS